MPLERTEMALGWTIGMRMDAKYVQRPNGSQMSNKRKIALFPVGQAMQRLLD